MKLMITSSLPRSRALPTVSSDSHAVASLPLFRATEADARNQASGVLEVRVAISVHAGRVCVTDPLMIRLCSYSHTALPRMERGRWGKSGWTRSS